VKGILLSFVVSLIGSVGYWYFFTDTREVSHFFWIFGFFFIIVAIGGYRYDHSREENNDDFL
jgi:hypothetical protein